MRIANRVTNPHSELAKARMSKSNTKWTPEADKLLEAAWADADQPSAEVVRSMIYAGLKAQGLTPHLYSRNAILGRVHRKGFNTKYPRKHGGTGRPRLTPRPGSTRAAQKIIKARERVAAAAAKRDDEVDLSLPPGVELAPSEHGWKAENPGDRRTTCMLVELSRDRCHWPLAEFAETPQFFCGDKTWEPLPYCAHHAARAIGIKT